MACLTSRPPSVLLRGNGPAPRPAAICSHAAVRGFSGRQPTHSAARGRSNHHHHHRPSTRAAASAAEKALGGDLLPQNTGNPLALPDPSLSPLQAAAAQLDALSAQNLDAPWPLHGVAVAYAFCADSGSLELSRYFAPMRTSLYHQDHFQGKFLTRFPGLVGHKGWELVQVEEEEEDDGGGVVVVRVRVVPSEAAAADAGEEQGRQQQTYVLVMVPQESGLRKGSWVTKQLVRLGEDGTPV
jgi:hypothetical protein